MPQTRMGLPPLVPALIYDFDIDKAKKVIADYYSADQSGNLSALDALLDNDVERFYKLAYPSHQDILNDINSYNEKYPVRIYTIDWSNFKYTIRKNILYAKIRLKYRMKKLGNSYYFSYDILTLMHIDANYKISYIYNAKEDKVN